jgi:hypothetical protein
MSRLTAVACALGLWVAPAAAQEVRQSPPALSAGVEQCTAHQRAVCQGVGQRAVENDLSCGACGPPPMPPDVIEPAEPASTGGLQKSRAECPPDASGAAALSCAVPPRLDNIPRP